MGSSDIGEVDRAGRRLRGRLGDDVAWFEEWVRLGDEVRTIAEKAEKESHGLSASAAYLRACCYYQMGERFRTPKDDAALAAFRISGRLLPALRS